MKEVVLNVNYSSGSFMHFLIQVWNMEFYSNILKIIPTNECTDSHLFCKGSFSLTER